MTDSVDDAAHREEMARRLVEDDLRHSRELAEDDDFVPFEEWNEIVKEWNEESEDRDRPDRRDDCPRGVGQVD